MYPFVGIFRGKESHESLCYLANCKSYITKTIVANELYFDGSAVQWDEFVLFMDDIDYDNK